MSLVYRWKYSKMKMEFIFVLIEKNLIKFIKEFAICQNKFASIAVVKSYICNKFNLFINNTCTTLTSQK